MKSSVNIHKSTLILITSLSYKFHIYIHNSSKISQNIKTQSFTESCKKLHENTIIPIKWCLMNRRTDDLMQQMSACQKTAKYWNMGLHDNRNTMSVFELQFPSGCSNSPINAEFLCKTKPLIVYCMHKATLQSQLNWRKISVFKKYSSKFMKLRVDQNTDLFMDYAISKQQGECYKTHMVIMTEVC